MEKIIKDKGGREKIILLIVEDDQVLLRALYMLFHKEKYTIATASDGDTALEMARRLNPNIILLDLLLPKMNGFDVLKNIKADPKLKDIPVVVLSNLGEEENLGRAKSLGAEDYFVKSETDLAFLANKIKEILKH